MIYFIKFFVFDFLLGGILLHFLDLLLQPIHVDFKLLFYADVVADLFFSLLHRGLEILVISFP